MILMHGIRFLKGDRGCSPHRVPKHSPSMHPLPSEDAEKVMEICKKSDIGIPDSMIDFDSTVEEN
jgi:hypothetical protein